MGASTDSKANSGSSINSHRGINSHRILVVEDEGLIARDIQNRLEALGHTVVGSASTAEEALAAAGAADVVLMDIRLDGSIDGIDAAAAIRERFHIPVIFLTAHADRSTVERAKQANPFAFIVKPLAHHSLQTSIEIAVHKHGIERELEEREARLQESETWLRTVLDSVADAVLVTDTQGRVRMHNPPAQILFQDIPHSVSALLPGDPVAIAILRDEAVPFEAEIAGQMVEGSVAPVKVAGCAVGTVLTLRDVTARRSQEQRIREAQNIRAASRLAADVAGEYGQLLAIVRKGTGQLRNQFAGYEPIRQPLDEVDQAAAQAQELTERLAGMGSRRLTRYEVVSLNNFLKRVPKLVEAVAGSRVHCSVHTDRAGGKMQGDPQLIEQMIMNLVIYACSMMPAGGKITVEADSNGETASLTLEYVPAPGMDADTRHAAATVATLPADREISLTTAHSIAAEHGGHFSASDGQLRVMFPQWQEPNLVPRPSDQTHNILLVEPRERVRAQLHNFFEANGYNLLEAGDALEAGALLELHGGQLDLVICPQESAAEFVDAPAVITMDQPLSQQALLSEVRVRLSRQTAAATA